MDVAVTDHTAGKCIIAYGSGDGGEVMPSDAVGLLGDSSDERANVGPLAVTVDVGSVRGTAVEVGCCLGEELGQAAVEGGCSSDGTGGSESPEHQSPRGKVHEDPCSVELAGQAAGGANGRDREPQLCTWRWMAVSNAAVSGSA